MRTVLDSLAGFLIDFTRGLGLWGAVLVVVGLVIATLAVAFFAAVIELLDAALGVWRRTPPVLRRSAVGVAAGLSVPTFISLVPWKAAFLAVVAAGLVVLLAGGAAWSHRYRIAFTGPLQAWGYHLKVKARKGGWRKAMDTSTGHKGNKAMSMRLAPNGEDIIASPGMGQSPGALVDQLNNGNHTSALKAQFGWHDVKTVSASDRHDGTVYVRVERHVRQPESLEPEWLDV